MAELSLFIRLVLTLFLLTLSLLIYKWVQKPLPMTSQTSSKRSKKRSKKKSSTKSTADSDSPTLSQESPQTPSTSVASVPKASVPVSQTSGDDDLSDSDSDDGYTAAQVLAKRKFKPVSLGGSRLAQKIKASLPLIDAGRFEVGQQVLARFGGGDRWFPAIVLEQRKGNAYHLKYDDGEVEFRVPAEFIKLQPTKSEENEGSERKDVLLDAGTEEVVQGAAVQREASDSESSALDDDGWQVVGTSSASKHRARRLQVATPAEPMMDGLTKRQRENRRKKERQREKKELLRQHAQKDDLDARARWRYVPS
ncbi:unnamed protein product [Peronospora belbahrii]|uniref:Tudor domain-containing protein n=1 Tax=Peronospora belbahrii TaxID=622444 RepID=A0AAU9L5Q5_9STRA|nr:unnamed protein product [Peronospora belbahrii]CAH0518122.1 unnamed protein product [Peronospora belbahrii]